MRPLTMIGSVTRWACSGESLGSCSTHSGSESRANGTRLSGHKRCSVVKLIDARRLALANLRQAVRGQVPALHGNARCFAGLAAQGENAGHKRQLAQGHAVDKILAAAEDRVVDLDHVVAVAGNFIVQHRIGMEAVAAGIGQFLALASSRSVIAAWNQPGTASAMYGTNCWALTAKTKCCPFFAAKR